MLEKSDCEVVLKTVILVQEHTQIIHVIGYRPQSSLRMVSEQNDSKSVIVWLLSAAASKKAPLCGSIK